MVPRFAESDYAGGIEAGLDALDAYILRPFAEGRSYEETPFPIEGSSSDWIDGAVIIAMILGGLALIFNKERFALGDMLAKRRPCPKCGRMGVTVVKETHPLSEARKERVTTRHCPYCQWSEERRQMVQTTTSGDDDFGGGQSSGGGATGRW